MDKTLRSPSRIASILSDVHFWVPLIVLIAGLILLKAIH